MNRVITSLTMLSLSIIFLTSCTDNDLIYKSEDYAEYSIVINNEETDECKNFVEAFNSFLNNTDKSDDFYVYIDNVSSFSMDSYQEANHSILDSFCLQYNINIPTTDNNYDLTYKYSVDAPSELIIFMTLNYSDTESSVVVKLDKNTNNITNICVG